MPLFGPPNIDKLKSKQDIRGLIKALTDTKHAGTGSAAAHALVEAGAPAVDPLFDALRHSDGVARARAAVVLGAIGDDRAVEPLLAALRDESAGVRMGAARSLGQVADARAVEPLIAALADPDADVRPLAAEALGQIGDARAVEPLITALCNDSQVRVKAAGALAKIGRPAVEALARALRPRDLRTLGDAAQILAQTRVPKVAAEVLGQIGDAGAVEPLIAALGGDDIATRSAAAEALGKICDARAVEPLVSALKDETGSVRKAAGEALLALYKSGKLDRAASALILNSRSAMAVKHTDSSRHVDAKDSSCWYERDEYVHTDVGIGVGLPL